MQVTLAKTAGFCFGVERAVKMAEEAAKSGKQTVTLGPLIHNRHVVSRFEGLGISVADNVEDVPAGATVIIRSHGVGKEVYEQLQERGAEILDATCPFVKRIHEIVMEAEQEGRQVIIMGTKSHPEVVGISGWCKHPLVLESAMELENYLENHGEIVNIPLTIVSQTTSSEKEWKTSCKFIKKQCTNGKIFDTICKATEKRQKEAIQLATACDGMIIVGDGKSSNTGQLAKISRDYCDKVALVDCGMQLDKSLFADCNSVGITAGASTPSWIIKEVNNIMSEEIKVETVEESFEALLEQSLKTLNTGEKVTGVITSVTPTVYVDLGTKHAGYIPLDEVSSDPNVRPEDVFKIGDEVEVVVVRVNDGEGVVSLSKKRLEAVKNWDDMEAACEEKTVVEAVITEENKGGVVANYKGIRVFIPASQTGVPKGGDLASLLKKTVQFRVTEVNRARRRVVGSIRDVMSEARKAQVEQIWSEIEEGKKYHGTVKSLTSYGAFVDIGGVDGMVHVSELSWSRIKNPAEVVSVGDEIDVYVISFDAEKKKISLGYKTSETNPWEMFQGQYAIGDVATVKVVKLMTFGAFAEIMPGVDGLIHISQIADRRIGKPEDVLSEGQEVEAKIIDVDYDHKRISLSIRALLVSEEEYEEEYTEEA